MALPTTPAMQELAAKACLAWIKDQEQLLRDLLGQWVSEIEPVIMYGSDPLMSMKGIGIAGDPTGMVVIPNPHYRPGLMEYLRGHGQS